MKLACRPQARAVATGPTDGRRRQFGSFGSGKIIVTVRAWRNEHVHVFVTEEQRDAALARSRVRRETCPGSRKVVGLE